MASSVAPGVLRLMQDQQRQVSPVREIVEARPDESALSLPGVVSEVGVVLPTGLTIEQWMATGFTLKRIKRAWNWWVGDYLNYGEAHFGEEYSQMIDEFADERNDHGRHQVQQWQYVARAVPVEMRREELPWSFHEAVAPLDRDDQQLLLEQAERGEWNRATLRDKVKFVKGELPPAVQVAEPPERECECHCHTDFCYECGKTTGPL